MSEKIKKRDIKEIKNLFITALESCHSQQHTPSIIEACKAPYTWPLLTFFNCKRRGGYLEAPFRFVLVTAIPRSFSAIADFQQTNKLSKNR
jgi:hypothetical protein